MDLRERERCPVRPQLERHLDDEGCERGVDPYRTGTPTSEAYASLGGTSSAHTESPATASAVSHLRSYLGVQPRIGTYRTRTFGLAASASVAAVAMSEARLGCDPARLDRILEGAVVALVLIGVALGERRERAVEAVP